MSHFLELLQRTNLDRSGGRLGLEHHLFFGEWIDAHTSFRCRLADRNDLQQPGKDELADGALLDVALDHAGKAFENSSNLLAAQFSFFSDLI